MAEFLRLSARRLRIPCGAVVGLVGCAAPGPPPAVPAPPAAILENSIRHLGQPDFVVAPRPERFSVCHGHGCKKMTLVRLEAAEWRRVRMLFQPPARSPQQEREQIRAAVALFERLIGPRNGTSADRGGTFGALGQPGQHDCVDESTNTIVYLALLQADGLLDWHYVAGRSNRGIPNNLLLRWPHSTAVIRERDSGRAYAVDSWFLDNGESPYIVPLRSWRAGWSPPS